MVDPTEITREVFRNIPTFWTVVFYLLVAIEIGVFLFGFYKLFRKYSIGKRELISRRDNIIIRLFKPFIRWNSSHEVEEGDRRTFVAHTMLLYGMILLFLGTAILTVEHDIIRPLIPAWQFYYGTFYIVYSLVMDIAGVAAITGLTFLTVRRYRTKPTRLDYGRVDGREPSNTRLSWIYEDKVFLFIIHFILYSGFILEGVRIVADNFPEFERFSFVGYTFALIFNVFMTANAAETVYVVFWWSHMLVVTVIMASLPYTKAMHIVIDYVMLVSRDEMAARRLPGNPEDADASGYNTIEDFSWRELISLDACTKCGKCHIACPAATVGHPLSPRDMILDLRNHASASLGTLEWSNRGNTASKDQILVMEENPVVLPDTIWSCTTCRACVTNCPVAIEHIPIIVQLRRRMVEEGEIDAGIQLVLENTGKYGNSFGKSNRQRAKWAKKMDPPIKDARKEEVEYLWFVGDFASFDQRAVEDTKKLARILQNAGVDFGILYEGEKTAGNDIRRIGEEGLFEMLVEDNIASFEKASFMKIITTDPHSLNTLRYEYPEFNSDFVENPSEDVLHYTQILWELIESGKITIKNKFSGKVTYHDPCYLGRYAQEYDAPRKIIEELGFELLDMPRCRENSFCCGAGGGQIFIGSEREGDRPAPNRVREANTLDVKRFIVACPKDKVMFGDAVKVVDGTSFQVNDISELLYQAMDIKEPETTE